MSSAARARLLWLTLGGLVAAVAVGPIVEGQRAYVVTFAAVSVPFVVVGLGASWLAMRRCHPDDRGFWKLWLAATAGLAITGLTLVTVTLGDPLHVRWLGPVAVQVVTMLFVAANLTAMRRRAGLRSLTLDAVECVTATIAIGTIVLTLFGTRILLGEASWFSLPTAQTFVGATIGLVWSLELYKRAPGTARRIEAVAVLLGVIAVTNSVGHVAMGVSNFTLPATPLLVGQVLTMAGLMFVPLHASLDRSAGLGRFAPQDQVRSSRALTIFTITSLPIIGLCAFLVRDDVTWSVLHVAVVFATLTLLSALRNLLLLHETKRLYGEVAVAADERQRLLDALMHSVDEERHRFAAQLHQQATASYASFASFIQSTSIASPAIARPLVQSSEGIRRELGRNAEAWRDLMLAVKPIEHDAGSARTLTTSIRAYAASVFASAPAPVIDVHVDDELVLDWATEAIVLRIVQETIGNVWRHADARHVEVAVTASSSSVHVDVTDDGRGFDPGSVVESGLATVRSFVALGRGSLDIDSSAHRGTTVHAALGRLGPVASRPQPTLRLVVNEP